MCLLLDNCWSDVDSLQTALRGLELPTVSGLMMRCWPEAHSCYSTFVVADAADAAADGPAGIGLHSEPNKLPAARTAGFAGRMTPLVDSSPLRHNILRVLRFRRVVACRERPFLWISCCLPRDLLKSASRASWREVYCAYRFFCR